MVFADELTYKLMKNDGYLMPGNDDGNSICTD